MNIKNIKYIFFTVLFLVTVLGWNTWRYENTEFGVDFSENAVWAFSYMDPIIARPQVYQNVLIVQTVNKLYANNAMTGELIWEAQLHVDDAQATTSRVAPFVVSENYIVAQMRSNAIAVYELKTGKLLWTSGVSPVLPEYNSAGNTFIKDIEIYNDAVYVSYYNASLVSYNALNGDLVWSKSVPSRTDLEIMVQNPNLYLGTIDSVISYNLVNGEVINDKRLNGSAWNFDKDGELIYIAFMNGPCSFGAIGLLDNKDKWCVSISEIPHSRSKMNIALDNENIYFVGDRLIVISKRTGIILWIAESWAEFKNPKIQNSVIFVLDGGLLREFDKESGEEIGRARFTRKISFLSNSDLSLINENMIYAFDDNSVEVFKILYNR